MSIKSCVASLDIFYKQMNRNVTVVLLHGRDYATSSEWLHVEYTNLMERFLSATGSILMACDCTNSMTFSDSWNTKTGITKNNGKTQELSGRISTLRQVKWSSKMVALYTSLNMAYGQIPYQWSDSRYTHCCVWKSETWSYIILH